MKSKLILLLAAAVLLQALCSCSAHDAAETTADPVTQPFTQQETEPAPASSDIETEALPSEVTKLPNDDGKYKNKTAKVTQAMFKSVCQRVDSEVMDVIIYCEAEPDSTIYVCDKYKNVLRCEKAFGPCFYTALPLEEGTKKNIAIYAKADGKALSDGVKLTLKHTDDASSAGKNVFCGKDSKIYLNWYDDHYYGRVQSSEEDLTIAEMMIRKTVNDARALTGKNTKLIVISATNPAVIYHDRQYDQPFGRGDSLEETSSTLLAKRLKDDPDIYFIDCRDILMEHRDEEIFYSTDSHWTQLGAYYCYLEMMDRIHRDFPKAPIAELLKYNVVHEYRVSDLMTDNFLNGYRMGMREYTTYVNQTPVSRVVNDHSPSIYYVGDSYTGAISGFFNDTFSEVKTNELYNYNFHHLQKIKPDYLVYVFTERNLDAQCSIVWSQTAVD